MKEISKEKFKMVNKLYGIFIKYFMVLFVASSIVCILSFNFVVCKVSYIGSLLFALGVGMMEYDRQKWQERYDKQLK